MNRRRTGESSGDEWKTGTIPKWWLLQKIFEIKTLKYNLTDIFFLYIVAEPFLRYMNCFSSIQR
jgi:hypothetical protein